MGEEAQEVEGVEGETRAIVFIVVSKGRHRQGRVNKARTDQL